jgi:hypothetical protein
LLIGLIIASLTINSFAQDSVPIAKGTVAPFSGILLSKPKAEQVRIELIERDQFKLFNETLLQNSELQNKIINNQKDQVEILLKQNDKLLKRNDSLNNTERYLIFGLGVLSTGLAVYGASLLVGK